MVGSGCKGEMTGHACNMPSTPSSLSYCDAATVGGKQRCTMLKNQHLHGMLGARRAVETHAGAFDKLLEWSKET
eukprot:scaffold271064_cov10-Tisochrysis_lutea.AAC.1